MAKGTARKRTTWRTGPAGILAAAQGELFAGSAWTLVGREEAGTATTLTARTELHDARLTLRMQPRGDDAVAVELELSADLPWLDELAARTMLESWLAGFDARARRLRDRRDAGT